MEIKEEILLEEIRSRARGVSERYRHQWQMRIMFMIFSASFVATCLNSKVLQAYYLPSWQQLFITLVLFLPVLIYDAHLGGISERANQYLKEIANKDESNYDKPFKWPIDNIGFCQRWTIALCAMWKADFIMYYAFCAILWSIGWLSLGHNINSKTEFIYQETKIMNSDLGYWANISSILTLIITAVGATVGLWGYFSYRLTFFQKRRKLEQYLEEQKSKSTGKGQQSLLHLVRNVGLTEDEIIQISFKSKKIERRIKEDEEGYAKSLLFEYV